MRPRPERLLDYREYPVLFVDDESENLRVFELAFRREFHVATAHSGEEALRLLHEMPAAVILSDQRMPGLSGVQLLERARDLDPKTVRILVTAYGDVETLRDAINNGSIYRFLSKPWRADEMRLTLRNAIEMYALDRERDELVRELAILNRMSQGLNQELEFERVLRLLLRALTEELEYDGATILLLEPTGERLEVAACAPADGEVAQGLAGFSIPCGQANAFVRRLAAGETEHWTGGDLLELAGPVQHFAAEIAAEEMLIVPLIGRHGVLGALAVDNRRGGRGFRASDRTLLGGLAAQASTALENARLVEDLRNSRDRVSRVDRLAGVSRLASEMGAGLEEPMREALHALSREPQGALARRALEHVSEVMEAVSELARGEGAGGSRQPCDIAELVGEVCARMEADALRCGVRLEGPGSSDLPKVVADRRQLRRALDALVRGALRSARDGGTVALRAEAAGQPGGVVLELAYPSPDLDSEQVERIFDPFRTECDPPAPVGFGLLLAHEIVAGQGGSMQVESPRPGEAVVRVTIPGEPDRVDPFPAE